MDPIVSVLRFAADFLPRPPRNWPVILTALLAYHLAKQKLPHLFEKSIKGDVAVVTGAASGIGRLIAIALAKQGCKLALIDLNAEAVAKAMDELTELGCDCRAYVCDVSKRDLIYATAKKIEEDFGRVDILVNNAGIADGKKISELDDDRVELTLKINTLALIYMTKAFLPNMVARNHGHVVNIASCAGIVGVPGLSAYCASKFGAIGFDESLRQELREMKSAVKTTCVCPMYIKTGMFLGAEMQPPSQTLKPVVDRIFPLLEPDYATDQIITAIKRNQAILVMPSAAYTTSVLKSILPTAMSDYILHSMGALNSMKNFKQTRPT